MLLAISQAVWDKQQSALHQSQVVFKSLWKTAWAQVKHGMSKCPSRFIWIIVVMKHPEDLAWGTKNCLTKQSERTATHRAGNRLRRHH